MKRVWWVAAATVLIISGYLWIRPTLLHFKQVRSIADGRTIASRLDSYRELHGKYPQNLESAVSAEALRRGDGWNHPWVYVSDGETYLLISFGRDHRPERTDYALVQSVGEIREYREICGQWDRDQIVSPLGVHQGCGK